MIQETQIYMQFKREKFSNEIRKECRENQFQKKRMQMIQSSDIQQNSVFQNNLDQQYLKFINSQFKSVKDAVQLLVSDDLNQNLEGSVICRQFTCSLDQNQLIDEFLDNTLQMNEDISSIFSNKIVKALINNCFKDCVQLQFECLWTISNMIASSEKISDRFLSFGLMLVLKQLSESQYPLICEKVIWLGANLCQECLENRDMFNQQVNMDNLVAYINKLNPKSDKFAEGIWAISSINRGRPLLNYQISQKFVDILIKPFIHSQNQNELISDAAWSLFYITANDEFDLNKFFSLNITKHFIDCLSKQQYNDFTILGILRIFGNLSYSNDNSHIDQLIDNKIVETIFALLNKNNVKHVQKECLWILSNLVLGTQIQAQRVLGQREYIETIIGFLTENGEDITVFEALTLFNNIMHTFTPIEIENMVQQGLLDGLICVISQDHYQKKTIINALDVLEELFLKGEDLRQYTNENPFIEVFCCQNGNHILERFIFSQEEQISKIAIRIMSNYIDQ